MSQPEVPAVAKAFSSLLTEARPDTVVWRDAGQALTARDLLGDIESAQPRGARYAHALMSVLLEMLLQSAPPEARESFKHAPDVTKRPREAFLAMYRHLPSDYVVHQTMSHSFTASEMVTLIEANDPDGLSYASDVLRVVRDVLARIGAD